MTLDNTKIRQNFPNCNISVHGKPLAYFDNAATTFKPQCVINAVQQHYSQEVANVHRGVHTLSEQATAAFEETRNKIRSLINAASTKEIIFTAGTTASINLIAYSYGRAFLKKEDEIIISHMEHHSNIVPWQLLCEEIGCILKVIPINDAGELIMKNFHALLGPRTKLVSVVMTSNSLGTINPVKEIIAAAHVKNIPVLIDGAQAVGDHAVDVQALNCDFFAFSGHKMFGPTGVGVLYGKESFLEKMPPFLAGGDMIASVTFDKTTYNTLPYKFEAGTPPIAQVIGLGAAVDYIQRIGLDSIFTAKKEILAYATKKLNEIKGVRLIGTAQNKTSIISFICDNIHPHDLGTLLDQEGIAIRTGHHCTQPVMQRFGIPATARLSMSIYNTHEEIDRAIAAIQKAQKLFT